MEGEAGVGDGVGWRVELGGLGGVTHHHGQPVVVELGTLNVFTQSLDATGEKKEGQDPCERDLEVSITPLKLPSTPVLCNSLPWSLPTPPTTSSFPKNSSRSVTLSRTTTLYKELG